MSQASNPINPIEQALAKRKRIYWIAFVIGVGVGVGLSAGYIIGKKLALEDRKAEAQELVTK